MGQMHSDTSLHFDKSDALGKEPPQPVLFQEDQVYPLKTSSKASSQKPMWEKLGDALSTRSTSIG